MSKLPPATEGTTIRTGREGQGGLWASDPAGNATLARVATDAERNPRRFKECERPSKIERKDVYCLSNIKSRSIVMPAHCSIATPRFGSIIFCPFRNCQIITDGHCIKPKTSLAPFLNPETGKNPKENLLKPLLFSL
jgi:hypothetical protein